LVKRFEDNFFTLILAFPINFGEFTGITEIKISANLLNEEQRRQLTENNNITIQGIGKVINSSLSLEEALYKYNNQHSDKNIIIDGRGLRKIRERINELRNELEKTNNDDEYKAQLERKKGHKFKIEDYRRRIEAEIKEKENFCNQMRNNTDNIYLIPEVIKGLVDRVRPDNKLNYIVIGDEEVEENFITFDRHLASGIAFRDDDEFINVEGFYQTIKEEEV
jgi:hypothetical protein